MLTKDTKKRISSKEALDHRWFKEYSSSGTNANKNGLVADSVETTELVASLKNF